MKIDPYLIYDGQCEAAFQFYARVLRGEIMMMQRFADSPGCEDFPASHRNLIMHARLTIGDQVLMASDNNPAFPYEGIKGCSVSINVDSPEQAQEVFDGLADGGNVQMPLQETFWAQRFGMLTDRFGVPWMVNCAKPGF